MELTDFLHAGANSGKLKVISMIFGWVNIVKIGQCHLFLKTLKSAE